MAEQPDYSDSCMLALYPSAEIASALAIPQGLDPASLHITLAFTGAAADIDIRDLTAAAIDAARTMKPFTARISGSGRFTGGEMDVIVALVDAPELEDLRAGTLAALASHGITVPREHGFTAHCSLLYLAPDEPDPIGRLAPQDFFVTAISVVHGTTRIDIPLAAHAESKPASPAIVESAREAYAAGWAETGGPLTDRVKAGCMAAIDLAVRHAHEPGILEATLQFGKLEGTWAAVFQRREHLMVKQTAALQGAWRDATSPLDLPAMIRQVRAATGQSESVDPEALRRARQVARDAAWNLLAWLPASRAWQALRTAMRTALQSGQAEGAADAIAIAGAATGRVGIDFDLAFAHAYQALENLGAIWADADGWLARILTRSADELGRILGDLASSAASYEEMVAAAAGVLDGASGDAVEFITDWALQTALSRGALALYADESVDAVSWVTAGDSRVCPVCEANESASPYTPSSFPSMPAHPRCRCAPSASFDLAGYAAYFTD